MVGHELGHLEKPRVVMARDVAVATGLALSFLGGCAALAVPASGAVFVTVVTFLLVAPLLSATALRRHDERAAVAAQVSTHPSWRKRVRALTDA